jgi:hypothetical protein
MRRDGQTDMTKLTFALRHLANAPNAPAINIFKHGSLARSLLVLSLYSKTPRGFRNFLL